MACQGNWTAILVGGPINSLILTQNQRLVIGMGTEHIFQWEIRSLKRGNLEVEPQPYTFHFTLQNRLLVASSVPPMIAAMQRNLKSYSATPVKYNSRPLLFSPDGSLLFSICISEEPKLCLETVVTNTETGKISWRLPSLDFREINVLFYFSWFSDRAVSSDNKLLAAILFNSAGEQQLELWNIETKEYLHTLSPNNLNGVKGIWTSLTFAEDSKTLAIVHYSEQAKRSQILLWHIENNQKEILYETEEKVFKLSLESHLLFFFENHENKSYMHCWNLLDRKTIFTSEGNFSCLLS